MKFCCGLGHEHDTLEQAQLCIAAAASLIHREDPSVEELARLFHDTYERLAPQYGYDTRHDAQVPWEELPENLRQLMLAVCAEIKRLLR